MLAQQIIGHADTVEACVSVDAGNRFISAAADGSVLSWEISAVRQFAGHAQAVTSLATIASVADQPPQLISGSLDGTVRRWNVVDGQQLAQLNHGGPVTSVAARPDGERLASASSNNTIRLWNGVNNQQLAQMQGDLRAQTLVAQLTQAKNDAVAKVTAAKAALDAAEQDLPVKTEAEKTAATALAAADQEVEAKATALASVSTQKAQAEKVAIDAAATAQQAALAMNQAQQAAAEMKAMAARLAQDAERAKVAAAADADNGQLSQAFAAAMAAATQAQAKAQTAEAAVAAPTKMATDTAQAAATAAQKAIAMGTPFATASTELATAQNARRTAQQAHNAAARDLKDATDAVPQAKAMLTETEALLAKVEAELTAATEAEQKAQMPVNIVAFSPDGRTLASGGDFATVHTWDSDDGKPISSYVGHSGSIGQLAFVADDALVSGSADKTTILWNLSPNWQLERVIGDINDPATLVDRVASLDISPDGKLLVTGGGVPSRLGEVKIWNIADGQLVRALTEPHTDAVSGVAFSPDGDRIATCGADRYVKVFSTATGQQQLQLEGHTNYVTGVAWRSGGKEIASSGSDATIRTWNAQTGDRVRTIEGFTKQVSAVRYVGATQFLVSSAGDPRVRMHNADNGGVQVNYPNINEYMHSIDAVGDRTTGIIAAGGHDGVLHLYSANGQLLHAIASPEPTPSETAADAGADQQVRAD